MNRDGRKDGRLLAGWWSVVALALVLMPQRAAGITLTLRDSIDPVPPGGVLTYTIRVNNQGGDGGGGGVSCFNPPPQCVQSIARCDIEAPACTGNSFTGYVCTNAANDGANCGVGDPPVPDPTVCIPDISGLCIGGFNNGLPCTGNIDCPGNSCACEFAFNEGDFCCVGTTRDPTLCIPNPTGICNGGPNLGQSCTAPHGQPTDECPGGGTGGNSIIVNLPVPTGTTFIDGSIILSGPGAIVSNDGTQVTFGLPPLAPCGIAGTPQCPLLTANFSVSPTVSTGTIIQSQAVSGTVSSTTIKTTVNTFGLRRSTLRYSSRTGRDRFTYNSVFTLVPSATLDPRNEVFGVRLETPTTTILDMQLPPGSVLPFSSTTHQFKSREAGLQRVTLRKVATQHYSLNLKAAKLDLTLLDNVDVLVTITIGDDVLTQPLLMLAKRAGQKFVALTPEDTNEE